MSEDKAVLLKTIAEEVGACTECRLHTHATNPVPGYGDPDADILFIGEAPGFNEDQQGLPFVGKSGKYLDYLLNLIELKREQVFITNVVKHRPPENRDPQADEITTCKHFLDRQIDIIDPLVIVTLGRFGMARFFPGAKISRIHGQPKYDENRAYYPLYHPAAALRNPPLRWDMEADIKRLIDVMAEVNKRREGVPDIPEPVEEPPKNDEPPEQLKLF